MSPPKKVHCKRLRWTFFLSFYGTDGDAFHKILLHEGIEQDDRAGGYAGEGEFHGLAGGRFRTRIYAQSDQAADLVGFVQSAIEVILEGIELVVVDVKHTAAYRCGLRVCQRQIVRAQF